MKVSLTMFRYKAFSVFLLFILIFLGPACNNTSLPVSSLESPTLSPTIGVTFTPTLTLTPVPSVTNSSVPTLTPIPTLLVAEAREMVLSLYKNNGECKFPCWWGIEPGKTSWSLTKNFLASFAENISPASMFDFFGKAKDYTINFPFDTKSGNPLSLEIIEQDDLIRFITAVVEEEFENQNDSKKYFLYSLLEEYGAPDQIYLYTQPYTPDNSFPFSVILYYKNQRFALIYMGHGIPQLDQIRGCFKNDFSFLSWVPNTISELDDFTKVGIRPEDLSQYRPLDEVTKLDVATFYETFKDPSTPFCLETPVNLWP